MTTLAQTSPPPSRPPSSESDEPVPVAARGTAGPTEDKTTEAWNLIDLD